jgi:ATP/maltotriose-dependent transcriptional regulator MalT
MADDDSPVDMTVYALLLLDGRWDDADSSARGDIVVESLRFDGLRLLAELEHLRGHNDRATQHLYAALPDGPSSQPSNYYFYSTLRLLRLGVSMALDAEDLTLAQAWIEAHDRWVDWSGRLLDRPAGLLLWSRYQRVRGDTDAALHLAHDALTQAESPRQPLALLEAHRLLGELLTGTGEYEQAGQHLDAAATIARAAAAPYEQALTLAAQAELAQRTGDAERLNVVVSEARRICEPLGARPLLERIARLDRSSAVTPAPDDLPLSPREVEVLRLVAIGLSNAEVGERLFISPRTVAQHLQSIYNKLAISSRTAAAAFAFEHGLVDVRDVRTQG